MHACMHACVHACLHVRMFACLHVCMLSSIILDGEGHRGGGAETVLWTADYQGDSQAKADEVVWPCAKNGPGETAKGHVLGDAGR